MGPQVTIVVREQANGLFSAGVADYCTLAAEDYPTPQGAINGLLARVEGFPAGWRGLWEVEAMKERALLESVGYPEDDPLGEQQGADPGQDLDGAGDDSFVRHLTEAENVLLEESIAALERVAAAGPGGGEDPNLCPYCHSQRCLYHAGADCPEAERLWDETERREADPFVGGCPAGAAG